MPDVTTRYDRVKLYEEVWAEAVTIVAKRYGVSDVALRKICRKLAVPLPQLGYWAKLAAGRKLPTPPLPEYSGPTEIVRERFVSHDHGEPDPEHLVIRREFEARREKRLCEEREHRRRARQEKRDKEMERLKALEEQASNWRRAEEILALVAAVEAKNAQEGGTIDCEGELGQWIVWARHKADWIDPLVNAKCPVLDEE